jgi:hypothetical protein
MPKRAIGVPTPSPSPGRHQTTRLSPPVARTFSSSARRAASHSTDRQSRLWHHPRRFDRQHRRRNLRHLHPRRFDRQRRRRSLRLHRGSPRRQNLRPRHRPRRPRRPLVRCRFQICLFGRDRQRRRLQRQLGRRRRSRQLRERSPCKSRDADLGARSCCVLRLSRSSLRDGIGLRRVRRVTARHRLATRAPPPWGQLLLLLLLQRRNQRPRDLRLRRRPNLKRLPHLPRPRLSPSLRPLLSPLLQSRHRRPHAHRHRSPSSPRRRAAT